MLLIDRSGTSLWDLKKKQFFGDNNYEGYNFHLEFVEFC